MIWLRRSVLVQANKQKKFMERESGLELKNGNSCQVSGKKAGFAVY